MILDGVAETLVLFGANFDSNVTFLLLSIARNGHPNIKSSARNSTMKYHTTSCVIPNNLISLQNQMIAYNIDDQLQSRSFTNNLTIVIKYSHATSHVMSSLYRGQ